MQVDNGVTYDFAEAWRADSRAAEEYWDLTVGEGGSIIALQVTFGGETNDLDFDAPCIEQFLHAFFGLKPGESAQLDVAIRMITDRCDFHHLPVEFLQMGGGSGHYLIQQIPVPDYYGDKEVRIYRLSDTTSAVQKRRKSDGDLAYFQAIMKHSPTFSVVKDLEGRYIHINPTAEKILGVSMEDAAGALPCEVLGSDAASQCAKEDIKVLEMEQVVHVEQEFEVGGRVSALRTVKFPAFDSDGCVVSICAVGTDVTKFKTIERRLYKEANFDLLTEIPNRLLGFDRLQQSLARAARVTRRVGLIVLDLGKFSSINEAFGVDAGDQLLVEAAWRLRACVRESDTVARFGGDQFALVLSDVEDGVGVKAAAEKVFRQLRSPFLADGRSIAIAPSVGVSVWPDDAAHAAELVANAESALGMAKQSGRNIVKSYDSELSREIGIRHRISTLLSAGIEKDEFHLEYQPLVDPITGVALGAEALLRWNSAELGVISPEKFIPVAEDNGQIHALGEWVLKNACLAAACWNRDRDEGIPVAVNVSPKQVVAYNFPKIVESALRASRLDPALLKLEITETAFASEANVFRKIFMALSDMGISLSLDDFGTGYSSLGYLKACPFNVIKIDRSFLSDVDDDPESQVLLRSIVHLAKSIGLTVVAEGVETEQQVSILRELECDQLQGFRFSRPLTEDAFSHFISDVQPLKNAA